MKGPFYSLLISLLTLTSQLGHAQSHTYSIRGVVLDSVKQEPLVMATVYVKDRRDSLVLGYALTDTKGAFLIKDLPKDSVATFRIFYTGYSHYSRTLRNVKQDQLDYGPIYLSMNSHELNSVTITGEKPPIAIRGDTIEFNAASFKTRPNSVLGDLLKKLPGVDVDQNGRVTANGKPVDKIMMDGKTFFGNDPKIAMENLPSAIVDKVQITDTKTREQEVTGDPASGDTKTINITLKKGMDHGYFGRAYAGYGTGKHDDASALVNYFQGKRRISLLGATNNINQVGFTPGEMSDMTGNGRVFVNSSTGSIDANGMSFGGTTGQTKTTTAGLNYNDDLGKKTTANASYFYGDVSNQNDTRTARQNILPDSVFYYNADNQTHDVNQYHRVTATFIRKDSLWNIYLRPYFGISHENKTSASTAASTGPKGDLINETNSLYTTDEQTRHFRNELDIYRLFKKKGQYLYADLNFDTRTTEDRNYNQYKNLFYDGSTPGDSANQYIDSKAQQNTYDAMLIFNQPLTKALALSLRYSLDWQYGITDQKTFDFDSQKSTYSELDSAYSNKFRSNVITQTPEVGLSFNADSGKWYAMASSQFSLITLHHYSFSHHLSFDQHQFYWTPNINIRYKILHKGYLVANYYAYAREPEVSQLLPITDNTNSLYQVRGNPDLKPSLTRLATFGYEFYDFKSGNQAWLGLTYRSTKDAIASVSSYDEQLRQLTTYQNVNGNHGLSLDLNLSKTKKEKNDHWQIKMVSSGSINQNHSFVNDVPYISHNYQITLRPSLTYGYKDLFEVTPSYRFNYQLNRYDIQALDNRKNTMYSAGFSGTLYWPSPLTWESDLDYTHNSDVAPGFHKGYWLWNASVGVDFLKQKRATLKFSVYDLLNQNINVRRNITDTYIEDTQTIILHQYFMLKLIYNLRRAGKKEDNSRRIYIF